MSTVPLIPAAQYLRMSTEHQQYSLDFQRAIIQSYAGRHNFIVVKTYTDEGKSGLVLRHREGLARLLHDVVAGGQPYRVILVYDVSRWGRFQDADESAHYEFLCKQSGAPIHYCAETFSNEATMSNAIMKAFKRVMAAEYSRELSDKTTLAMTRLVQDGLWAGSMPGFGLRRMLVSSDGKPKTVMNMGEWKQLRRDRTVLVPGPADEIRVIKEIFRLYIKEKRSMPGIARRLNELGILHGGVPWTYQAIRLILFSEKYAGSLVWGRYTQKLQSKYVPVPKEKWVVAQGVIEPIVDRQTFDAARTVWANRTKQFSDKQYLDSLRSLLETSGRLNARLINESAMTPSSSSYINRFGNLGRAYQLIDYVRTDTFKCRRRAHLRINELYRSLYTRLKRLFPDLRATHENPRARPKTLRFATGLRVAIAVCHAEKTLRGDKRWRFESRHAQRSGLVTLLCFSRAANNGIDHFVVIPSALHIPVVSLLRENDPRLSLGRRLRALRDFRQVAHSMGRVSNASPSRR